jgi:hypothetical protein
MTIAIDSQNFESYVPVYDVAPKTWDEARPFIVEQLKKLANAVNSKEIGFFLDLELLSGKAFIPGVNNPNAFRQVLRKVIDMGPLLDTGTTQQPHEIVFDNNFTLVQIFGAATAPSLAGIPLPMVEVNTAEGNIELFMDSVNVYIITTGNRSLYTRSYVVIEYLQEL